MKRCRGVYNCSFGSALTFAAKAYQHTVQQLGEMARDPNTGLKRFAHLALAKARDLCLPYCGMLVERADDPRHGFVFRSQPCSRVCSSGTCCSDCASQTLIEPDIHWHAEKSATIQKITNNPILAAMEIQLLCEEIRSLHCQFAQKVLLDELGKHGTDLSDGATPGNQIRRAIGLMDRPITEALEKGSAPEVLELWHLHSEHISQVYDNGGKGGGWKRVAYHPLLFELGHPVSCAHI
jgi:hypothetical protein